MFFTSGTTGQPKGVVLTYDNLRIDRARTRRNSKALRPRRRGARLPAAGLDRPEHLFLRAVARRRLLRQLPGVGRHGDDRSARDRPDLFLRPAAHLREHPDQRHDPHGRCRRAQAGDVQVFHGRRPPRRHQADRRQEGVAVRPAALRHRRRAGVRAAEEHAGLLARARGLHRRRGDRAGDLPVLPLARHQPQAALRLDRSGGVRLHPAQRRGQARHGRQAGRRRGTQDRRQRRGAVPRPGRVQGVLQEPARPRPRPRRPTAGCTPATPASSTPTAT